MNEAIKHKLGRKSVGVLLLLVAAFMIYWQLMMVIPPTNKAEHHWLFSLEPSGSAGEYFFKRLNFIEPEVFFVGAHGVGGLDGIHHVQDNRLGKSRLLTPAGLAKEINREKIQRGIALSTPIYLLACNGGSGSHSFAQELSNILKVDVIAPDQWLFVYPWGETGTGRSVVSAFFNSGGSSFRRFKSNLEYPLAFD